MTQCIHYYFSSPSQARGDNHSNHTPMNHSVLAPSKSKIENPKSPMYPPGPRHRLLLGNSPWTGSDPLHTLASWAREYGEIVHFRRFHYHVYFLRHPDQIEQVLATYHRNFSK